MNVPRERLRRSLMNASEVMPWLVVSLTIVSNRLGDSYTKDHIFNCYVTLVLLYLFAYVNTNAWPFLCLRSEMNGTTNTAFLLEKWTRSPAPSGTRDPLSLWRPAKAWDDDCRAYTGSASSHTPRPTTVATSKSVKDLF
jgi:hypothetical protein